MRSQEQPRDPSGRRNERPAIEAVIRVATREARLVGYPEEDGSGPSVPRPCDALYSVGDERLAVEHTTVDIYQNERLARARFVPLAGQIERALSPALNHLLIISLPSEPLPRGVSWRRLAVDMEAAIREALSELRSDETLKLNCLGVPVHISKDENDGIGQVFVARQYPSDIAAQRAAIWLDRITDKRDSLILYHQAGYRTVLILETDDLGNRVRAARQAFATVSAATGDVIHDVWAVMTATTPWLLLPLKEHGTVDVGRRWISASERPTRR